MDRRNVIDFLNTRQTKDNFAHVFQRKMQVNKSFVNRLSLQCELEGHTGCVNCLQWNEAGDLLASGSDDLNIILWAPFLEKKCHTIHSGHHGNIFSVKFLPGSNDRHIVSGAADFKVRVNDIAAEEALFSCNCHGGRVKRLAAAANVPNMFWSAAEDGMILQYDLRVPHQCSNVCTNVLVNLVNHLGRTAEAKCIAINPINTDLIAVGANDPYVRMYDRRMIKLTTARFAGDHHAAPWDLAFTGEPVEPGDDNLSPECASYFIAGHLPLKHNDFKRQYRSLTATYVTFSPDGKDLLANLGGEQIYLFNIQSKRKQMIFNMSQKALSKVHNFHSRGDDSLKMDCCDDYSSSRNGTNGVTSNGVSHHSDNCLYKNINTLSPVIPAPAEPSEKYISNAQCIPKEVDDMKDLANQAYARGDYSDAITLYNSAIVLCPDAASLYSNRAASYIKRGWAGDHYAAIRDCRVALNLDPSYLKAHFRLAQCLQKLKWTKEAFDCLQAFKIKHPNFAKTKAFEVFENNVRMDIFADISKSSQSNDNQVPSSSAEGENGENESEDDSTASGSNSLRSHFSMLTGISDIEKTWRASAYDYEYRYCGHCNTTTDIKEANFFGSYGDFIIAGSDDGFMFIWNRVTTNIVRILRGDESIVNCLQPHPSSCVLATSGIDPVVRIWSPRGEDGTKDDREVLDKDDAAFANQRRMNADPLEIMLLNMGYRLPGVLDQMPDDLENRPGSDRNVVQCRTS